MSNYSKRREAEAIERRAVTKKNCLIILCVLVVVALIAGGMYYLKNRGDSNATGTGNADFEGDPNYDVFDYVTLGDYEGLDAYYVTPEVTKNNVKDEIDKRLEDAVEYSEFDDRAVKSGDKVNVDFIGKIDGEEFDGGTSKDYSYTLGEGSMIEGFDEGLYGANVGDKVTLNLTFPEDYSNADVAGKDVVFEVTINSAEEITYQPEWNDEFVKKSTDGKYTTTKEYKKAIEKELLADVKKSNESKLENDVWQSIYDNTTFNGYPEYLYNKMTAQVTSQIEQYSSMYGIDENTYLQYFAGGVSKEDYIIKYVNSQLLNEALIKTLKLELSDEEYEKMATADLENYGVKTIEEFEKQYSKDAISEYYLSQLLMDKLVEISNVKEISAEEYEEIQAAKQAVDEA